MHGALRRPKCVHDERQGAGGPQANGPHCVTCHLGRDSNVGSAPSTPSDLEGTFAGGRGPKRFSLSGRSVRAGDDDAEEQSATPSSCSSASTPDDLSGIYAFDAIALKAAALSAATATAAAAAERVKEHAALEAAGEQEAGQDAGGASRRTGGGAALQLSADWPGRAWRPREEPSSTCRGPGRGGGQRRRPGACGIATLEFKDPFTAAMVKQEVGSRQRGDTPVPTGKAAARRRTAVQVHQDTMALFGLVGQLPNRNKPPQHFGA